MLDQRRVAAQPDERREQLFTERYESLLAWAMGLTNQQREAAEDLVQDAFVQFVLGRTRLEEIENIDGYLRRMLRYMHVSRLSRSAQHLHETALSVADYDSGRLGWTAIEPPRRMQASEELHQICTYACARKESSRAGSVFILRFFHEYFPTEIAAILNSNRHCVDQWQGLARREAKLFLNEPRRLSFVNARKLLDQRQTKYLKSDCDLMPELRQMIFDSRRGECLSAIELDEIYTRANPNALTTTKLAHIVSCSSCLDAVNSLLGLPLLAQRYRTETHEDPPDDANGGASGNGGSGALPKEFAYRLRETHEHKPDELRISVNGSPVSSLKVSSELSELNLNLPADDTIEFVEIDSEQGTQLLFFSLDPSLPHPDQWAWIELSEGRFLEAGFGNGTDPTLHVVYEDPVPAEAYITGDILSANALSSPLFVVPAAVEWDEPHVGICDAIANDRSWVVRLFNRFKRAAGRGVTVNETAIAKKDEALANSLTETAPLFSLLKQADERKRSWQNFAWVILLISAVVVSGFLYFKAQLSPTLSATALLEKARLAENRSLGTADRIKHRVINLEERRSAEGAVIARRKIEIWSNHAKQVRAQRLYDDTNRLIAAAWQKADGSRTVYHHGSRPRSEPPLTTPVNLLLNLENIWQLEPASETFATLIANPVDVEVEERLTTYVLTFAKERAIGASRLLKATLTINKSDLLPVEQTLLVQRGGENGEGGELREYRFVEASSTQVPSQEVAPSIFEVEPELTGGTAETGKSGDWALRNSTTSLIPPAPSASTPPVASAELEVDVTYLLNQAKADRNEQVTLTRSAGGSLRVEGIVETEQRKQEFLSALAPVANNPAVKIEIRTVADALQRSTTASRVSVREVEETANTIAAHNELQAYFEKRNPSDPTDELIRSYSSRVVDRSYRASFQTAELKRLVASFANYDMRTVAPDARAKWLSMIKDRARSFEREAAALRQEIQPVFFPGASNAIGAEPAIQDDAELARAVEQLQKLAQTNSNAVRSALTISSQSSATALKSANFWNSLLRAERLATQIRQYGG